MSGCFNTSEFCNTATTNHSWPDSGAKVNSVTGGLIAIAVAICVVNGLVFCLFLLKSQLRTVSNYFLLSLTISDFSAGSVVIPMGLIKGLLLADDSPELDKHSFMYKQLITYWKNSLLSQLLSTLRQSQSRDTLLWSIR